MPEANPPLVILNVDEVEASRYSKTRILTAAGFAVREASTSGQALELISAIRPDLVVVHARVPDVNGIDVCRAIRANSEFANTLVLQTSATFVGGNDRVSALESGADSYLAEPSGPEELIANVRALLRLRQAELLVSKSERTLRLATKAAKLDTWSVAYPTDRPLSAAFFVQHSRLLANSSGESGLQLHADDVQALETAFAAALDGKADYDVEYRVRSAKGTHWIASQAVIIRDPSGRPQQIIGVAQDITDRKEAALERDELLRRERAARLDAEEATRLKDEFMATLSHELRTPLNAITGWVHLLRGGRLTEADTARALETIDRNARSQSSLINDLLDVSRIISGKLRLEIRAVSLSAVINSAIETVRPVAQAKNIRINCSVDSDLGPIAGDQERLQQVVWNLLTNAVKFSESGATVDVVLRKTDAHAELAVTDSGAGIAAEFLPYVFHAFRQAEGSANRRHPGLGLGLAIVKHMVELHGGRVHASSAGEGKGSTITVELPIGTPAATGLNVPRSVPEAGSTSAARSEATPNLAGVRVLVLDDEPDARDILASVLSRAGANVTATASAKEALAALDAATFEVLVSDVGLPEQDGYTFIRAVRARDERAGGRIPAAALTAYARPEDRMHALSAGFQVHVAKPVQPLELLAAVAQLAGRNKAQS